MMLPYRSCALAAAGSSKARNDSSSKKLVSFFFIVVLRSLNERFVSGESERRTQPSAGCRSAGLALPARELFSPDLHSHPISGSWLFNFLFALAERNVLIVEWCAVGLLLVVGRVRRKAVGVVALA